MSLARWKRLWLVLVDHSVVGVKGTKQEAEDAVRLRQEHTISNVEHYIDGPFVRKAGATTVKLAPEWISRCACGATYRHEKEWQALSYVGVMDFDTREVLELRNCIACGSTISRRSSLKKGAKKVKR